ncbi:MAG: hypothetical protein ABL888_10565 [Pirellulaceae bacterium]
MRRIEKKDFEDSFESRLKQGKTPRETELRHSFFAWILTGEMFELARTDNVIADGIIQSCEISNIKKVD